MSGKLVHFHLNVRAKHPRGSRLTGTINSSRVSADFIARTLDAANYLSSPLLFASNMVSITAVATRVAHCVYTRSFDHPLIEARVLISMLEPSMSFERIPPPGARIYEQLSRRREMAGRALSRYRRRQIRKSMKPGRDGVFSAQ